MNNISLTLPLIPGVLEHAADFLTKIAGDLEKDVENINPDLGDTQVVTISSDTVVEPIIGEPTEPAKNVSEAMFPPSQVAAMTTPQEDTVLDSRNMPWDDRIHASTKTQTKDGAWKLKKGVDKNLVAQVEAGYLSGKVATYAETPTDTLQNVAPVVTPPSETQIAPVVTPPSETVEGTSITTYAELMAKVMSGVVDPVSVTKACAKFGLNSLPLLAARQDLVPKVAEELGL